MPPAVWYVRDINKHLQSGVLNDMLLKRNYETKWPCRKQALDAVLAEYKDASVHEVTPSKALGVVYQLSREAIQLKNDLIQDSFPSTQKAVSEFLESRYLN